MHKPYIQTLFPCLVAAAFAAQIAVAQGLAGSESPSPKGGTPAGGPLIPGKSDPERWKFLQTHLRELIGMKKGDVISMFGKQGGPGLEKNMLVYQITKGQARKNGKTASIDLDIKFDDNDTVNDFRVVPVGWL